MDQHQWREHQLGEALKVVAMIRSGRDPAEFKVRSAAVALADELARVSGGVSSPVVAPAA